MHAEQDTEYRHAMMAKGEGEGGEEGEEGEGREEPKVADRVVVGGNEALVKALANKLPVQYGKRVDCIALIPSQEKGKGKGQRQVEVTTTTTDGGLCEQRWVADAVVVTCPLGVLKANRPSFDPPLPPDKQGAIHRLGFGVVNKCVLLFQQQFWHDDQSFGSATSDDERRGFGFLFYSYAQTHGAPLLVGLIAGKAAHAVETMAAEAVKARMMDRLRAIFGADVPEPIDYVVTGWKGDEFAAGSYSHVAKGASGEDYDVMAEPAWRDNDERGGGGGMARLFFAGEHTCRAHPATMHGAFLSGMRAAGLLHHDYMRTTHGLR